MVSPGQLARQRIDAALRSNGWAVQDYAALNHSAGAGAHRAVAVREFPMATGQGDADDFLDGDALGVFAQKLADDLRAALEQIEGILEDLPKEG